MPEIRPEEFFRALWGEAKGFVELRLLRPKPGGVAESRSSYYHYPEQLEKFLGAAKSASGQWDVYFGVCLRHKARGSGFGGSAVRSDVQIATCCWVDVDLYHKDAGVYKPRYDLAYPELKAKVAADLQKFTRGTGITRTPTAANWSGGGFHVFWVFAEPVDVLAEPEEGLKIEAANYAIGALVGSDPVFDLSRILRVPGTKNLKGARPGQPEEDSKECRTIIWHAEKTWNHEDLVDVLDTESALEVVRSKRDRKAKPAPKEKGEPVNLDELSIPDQLKEVIRGGQEAYAKFRQGTDDAETFEKRKRDGRLSRSDADAYVVTALMYQGIPEDMIIRIYDTPGHKISAKYDERGWSYLQHTLGECEDYVHKHPKTSPLKAADALGKRIDSGEAFLNPQNWRITKIVKFNSQPPKYSVTMSDGEKEAVFSCDIDTIYKYQRFEQAVYAAMDIVLSDMKQPRWKRILSELTVTVNQTPDDVSESGELRSHIEDWLTTAREEGLTLTNLQLSPVIHEGAILCRYAAVKRYLNNQKVPFKRPDIWPIFHEMGAQDLGPRKVEQHSVRLWKIPLDYGPNGQEGGKEKEECTQPEIFNSGTTEPKGGTR